MIPLLIYLVKSSVCLILFYLFYKILLSRETFFRFNRYVLLLGICISLVLPFIMLKTDNKTIVQKPFIEIEELIRVEELQFQDIHVPEISRNDVVEYQPVTKKKPFAKYIQIIYVAGFCLSLILLGISIIRLTNIIGSGNKIKTGEYTLIICKQKICPFSFGSLIVISETDYKGDYDGIILHECEHISRKHSIDVIFVELVALFFWFNPAIWLLKHELKDIHEYEADNGVIQKGIDATKYQLLLVRKAVGARSYAIANSFNHSKLKKRITMMLKEKSNSWAQLKVLLLVPIAAVCLQAFARPVKVVETSLMTSESITNPQDLQQDNLSNKPDSVSTIRDIISYVQSSLMIDSTVSAKIASAAHANNVAISIAQSSLMDSTMFAKIASTYANMDSTIYTMSVKVDSASTVKGTTSSFQSSLSISHGTDSVISTTNKNYVRMMTATRDIREPGIIGPDFDKIVSGVNYNVSVRNISKREFDIRIFIGNTRYKMHCIESRSGISDSTRVEMIEVIFKRYFDEDELSILSNSTKNLRLVTQKPIEPEIAVDKVVVELVISDEKGLNDAKIIEMFDPIYKKLKDRQVDPSNIELFCSIVK